MRNTKLGYEEFEQTLLDQTSPNILNDAYIEKYEEFCNNLFFDLWKDYYNSEYDLGVRHYSSLLEMFFSNLFIFKPSVDKINELRL